VTIGKRSDERESSIVSQLVRVLETHRLMESVERVPERQRRVLVRRYGLEGAFSEVCLD
jgi:DNA-directed RNA polymerase specialized sigma24 family protein